MIAIRGGNMAWGKKHIRRILLLDHQKILFDPNHAQFFNDKDFEKFKKNFIKALLFIREKISDKLLGKLFMLHMGPLLDGPSLVILEEKTDSNWSLKEIREVVKTYNYGKKYFGLWYHVLYEKAYGTEAIKFLEETLFEKRIEDTGADHLWVYAHYFPAKSSLRKAIFKEIDKAIHGIPEGPDPYIQYVVLSLLKNETIKRAIVKNKKNAHLRRPLFQLKREFYLKLLRSAQSIPFSLYQLIKLGDKNEDLLWWMIL